MLRRIPALFGLILIAQIGFAGEGMWLPQLLKALNEGEMQTMGMKLSAEDIYSVNKGSLKDAIVHFGGFCTGELISDQGLLLTNHHCGYGQIQSHSSMEDNFLKNGFWAKTKGDEKPNPGLFVRFVESIDDVTDRVLKGVDENMSVSDREALVEKNIALIKGTYRLKQFQEIIIRPFYHGNQYFLFRTVTYNDVRLVGTPPESIGKFGADTDNWVWPRHTGDFSLFRVYADKNNEPAEYAEDNIPYTPKHFLPVSLDGVEEGDFTMVFGFPGRTNQYLHSAALTQIRDVLDPAKIGIRQKALDILDKYMRGDEHIRLQYSSKFARIANSWKKWIGESTGLKKYGAVEKKLTIEKDFSEKASEEYDGLLPEFERLYGELEPYAYARDFYYETARRNIEIMRMAYYLNVLVKDYEEEGKESYMKYKDGRIAGVSAGFYKDYRNNVDKDVFVALINHYKQNVDKEYWPTSMSGDMSMEDVFSQCSFTTADDLDKILALDPENAVEVLKADPLLKLFREWEEVYSTKIGKNYGMLADQIDSLQRIYMKGLMETFPDRRFYPDANSTMRVTYGQVNGYQPRDAVNYNPVSYLDGVIEKYVPGDYEFDVDEKLLSLYESKDYGDYADSNGKIPICFLGSNHTTGGNSGSPAIDANGNLIGLNFDRVWEGTMSDLNYDPEICRNIMVDARYILFVVDKLGGAKHLVDEMKLVHPKKKMVINDKLKGKLIKK